MFGPFSSNYHQRQCWINVAYLLVLQPIIDWAYFVFLLTLHQKEQTLNHKASFNMCKKPMGKKPRLRNIFSAIFFIVSC